MMKRHIFINCTVLTMDDRMPEAEAFGVLGERFAVVGTRQEVTAWGGDAASVKDLGGRTVLPGFIETHNHLSFFSLRLDHINCGSPPNTTIAQILALVAQEAETTPAGEWIFGYGFDDSLISDNRHLNRDELDNIAPDQYVMIFHTSGHLGYVNSNLLDLMGIDDNTPNPEGGEIHRDKNGRATGLLKETAIFPIMDHIPKPDLAEIKSLLYRGAAVAGKVGVTSVHDAAVGMEGAGPLVVQAYRELAAENKLGLRAYLTLMSDLFDQYKALGLGSGFGNDHVRIGSVKLFQDGSIQGHTGWLSQPYHDRQEDGFTSGYIMPQKDLDEKILACHSAGLQIAIHGNGDAAIESIIQAVEKAQAQVFRKDPRHLLIHCQTVREDQIPRMKACGLMPSYFVDHVYFWGDRHRDIFLGPERAARISPLASSLEKGVIFTLHSDLPVTPMNPLHSIHTAVNRLTRQGKVLGPDQRISVKDALKSFTIWAAMAGFEEDIKGTVTPGKLADWVVLSDNPEKIDPAGIENIQVLETVVGGCTVYAAQACRKE